MKFNFNLNKMQEQSKQLNGENILLNAPTGSGKTEAILLNLKKGENYYYFLPTITSCIFMYNRLKNIEINVNIKTSILTEKTKKNNGGSVTICTPDPIMIGYLDEEKHLNENLILDELDNYPIMVQSVLLDYIKKNNSHIIVASATLNEELMEEIKKISKEIKFAYKKNFIKHKIDDMYINDIKDIIKHNQDKKIGIICNSINNMEEVANKLENNSYIFHNAQLDEHTRLKNEQKLFDGDFKIVISNDLISFSIDIDFDILIMECSDKLNMNIQRIGRNNRYNKNINYKNLYILKDLSVPPFIDFDEKWEQEQIFLRTLTYNQVLELKKTIKTEQLPTVDYIVGDYWKKLKENKEKINLREVPLTFKYNFEKKVVKYINKKKVEEVVETSKLIKINGDFPWGNASYNSKGEKVYIHHKGVNYKILNRDQNGIYLIDKTEDIKYLYCSNCNDLITEDQHHWGEWECYNCVNNPYHKNIDLSNVDINNLNKEDLLKIIIKNFTIDNTIDISGLDLSKYEEIKGINFSGIKGKIYIDQSNHENDGNVWQMKHKSKGNVVQSEHQNTGRIDQSKHRNGSTIDQSDQENKDDVYQTWHKNKGDVHQYYHESDGNVYQYEQKNKGHIAQTNKQNEREEISYEKMRNM